MDILSPEHNCTEREVIWKYKYLGITPDNENDKVLLVNYLKSIEDK